MISWFRKNRTAILFVSILLLAFALRVPLAVINHSANDNHFEVVRLMFANNGEMPQRDSCKQCYHPPLYYTVVYHSIRGVESVLQHSLENVQREHIGQYLNVLAGIGTLSILYLFLSRLRISVTTRLIIFALLAVNPRFTAINIQMTNDSFVIFFGVFASNVLWRYLQTRQRRNLVFAAIGVLLAILTKGTGILLFLFSVVVLMIVLLFSFFTDRQMFRRTFFDSVLFVLIIFLGVVLFSPYYHYYKAKEPIFAINREKGVAPALLHRASFDEKTSVVSLYDAYATFHIKALLQYPLLTRKTTILDSNGNIIPSALPRTSLWTNLYARWNVIQYEKRPRAWKNTSTKTRVLTRGIYLLGLVPLGLLFYGFLVQGLSFLKKIRQEKMRAFLRDYTWFFFGGVAIFLLFIIKFSYDYPIFPTMKAIYLFPGLLFFVYFFAHGLEASFSRLWHSRYGRVMFLGICGMLFVLFLFYIFDIMLLLQTLLKK